MPVFHLLGTFSRIRTDFGLKNGDILNLQVIFTVNSFSFLLKIAEETEQFHGFFLNLILDIDSTRQMIDFPQLLCYNV